MFRPDTHRLVRALNQFDSIYATDSHIPHNVGSPRRHGSILAQQMKELYGRTGKPGIIVGHSDGGIDAIAAVNTLVEEGNGYAVQGVHLVSTPLRRKNAFTPRATTVVHLAEVLDPLHLMTANFLSSGYVEDLLSHELPGVREGVEYTLFYSPHDNVVNQDAMHHPSIPDNRKIMFVGSTPHLLHLHDPELIMKVAHTITRRGTN